MIAAVSALRCFTVAGSGPTPGCTKLTLVVLMTIAHMMMGSWRRPSRKTEPALFVVLRIANEVPTVLMILIVILVIVKPDSAAASLPKRFGKKFRLIKV